MLTGGCQCGSVRYEITGDPLVVNVCHCRECQAQSASAFGVSVRVRRAAFAVVAGEVACWSRPGVIAARVDCLFCPGCGTRVWHHSPGAAIISVKGGSLDVPPDLSAACYIWVTRKLPGVLIPPSCEQWPEEPPD